MPVFFLVVEEGSVFRFRIASRGDDPAALEQGMQWLADGLEILGAGAKTAVGYGAMSKGASGGTEPGESP